MQAIEHAVVSGPVDSVCEPFSARGRSTLDSPSLGPRRIRRLSELCSTVDPHFEKLAKRFERTDDRSRGPTWGPDRKSRVPAGTLVTY